MPEREFATEPPLAQRPPRLWPADDERRSTGISTEMVSLTLAGKKQPSTRMAVALVHGLEKLLTRNRRLDTVYFIKSPAGLAVPSPP